MKGFTYTITDSGCVHVCPTGMLTKAAKTLDSTITITTTDAKSAAASKLMEVMRLGVKVRDTVTIAIESDGEETDTAVIEQFFRENL